MIRTITWQNNTVVMIDQKRLPREECYLTCHTHREVIAAINDLTIRGAPAIGIAAAMGIALGMLEAPDNSPSVFRETFDALCREFQASRPTARNLFWAVERMKALFDRISHPDAPFDAAALRQILIDEAGKILEEDIACNRKIGAFGAELIRDGDAILTHCNAGALATGGYGTALGVIRTAWEQGKKIQVFVDETRPVLQGARLTAWELMREQIPATLITDNMAGFLMSRGKIARIITGADRIARNGDTANKIGTYTLAVLAKEHGIPLYIAAPTSTVDPAMLDGSAIPIEERDPEEVTTWGGRRVAPEGITVFNPAFDVTPARYITAIITEEGVSRPPYDFTLPGN
ncbi:MAG TPA: S-methyl-5-thioribose-1-phosphate isomerase [Syntrophales bacterium]|nr:S-methyl-5-thioribose-1-phosphate isomerase [Syntrophales bacterium]